jgi:long-chain acyl-CoA synthetase
MTMSTNTRIGRSTATIDPSWPRYETVVHALAAAARIAPERTALVCGDSRLTYTEYLRAVAGLAHHLARFGVAGGRVAVLMSNSNEMAVAMLGAMTARAQMAPLNPFFTMSELRPLLADAAPMAIVSDAATEEKARALAAEVGVAHVEVFKPGALSLDRWTRDASLGLPEALPARTDWATLPYSGGTTGVPKGVMHQHGNITSFFVQVYGLWPLGFDTECFLNVAPMFHIWGFQFATWMPIFARSPLVIVPKYEPVVVLEQLARHKVTVFEGGPPAIYMGLMAAPTFRSTDFSSLKYCLSGGAPCPEQLLRSWEAATGCVLLEGIGMSEGAPMTANPIHGVRKLGSVGPVSPGTEIDIVDVETGTRVLGVGEPGEIRVRGPQFTQGYRNRPEETARALRDGWLYTGDIGYFDADSYLFIVDRKKDMALVGGYNVYPREIDELLFRHPKIQEAAAFGVPDERLGETIAAFVVLRPGEHMSEEDCFAYCAENLVKYKRPTVVKFVGALPRTGANKIDKRALKAQLLAGKQS